jgi:hypothetical protein
MKNIRLMVLFGLLLVLLGVVFLFIVPRERNKLTLSDFAFLEPGMSLPEIVDKVGQPDRDIGSGFYMPQYDLVDGGVVGLGFGGDPSNLLVAVHESKEGTVTVLVGDAEK